MDQQLRPHHTAVSWYTFCKCKKHLTPAAGKYICTDRAAKIPANRQRHLVGCGQSLPAERLPAVIGNTCSYFIQFVCVHHFVSRYPPSLQPYMRHLKFQFGFRLTRLTFRIHIPSTIKTEYFINSIISLFTYYYYYKGCIILLFFCN